MQEISQFPAWFYCLDMSLPNSSRRQRYNNVLNPANIEKYIFIFDP